MTAQATRKVLPVLEPWHQQPRTASSASAARASVACRAVTALTVSDVSTGSTSAILWPTVRGARR